MSQPNESLEEIEARRVKIDELDKQIVALLNERANLALDIRDLKPGANMGLYDPKREEEIFVKLCSYNDGPLYDENLKEIYRGILKVMKEVPNRD